MGAVRDTGRGVGDLPLGGRARFLTAGAIVLALVCALGLGIAVVRPSAGRAAAPLQPEQQPVTSAAEQVPAQSPQLAAATLPLVVPSSSSSDRMAQLIRQIRTLQAQITTTEIVVRTLTLRRDTLEAELKDVQARAKEAGTALKAATAAATSAVRDHQAAEANLKELSAARKTAQSQFDAAQDAQTKAQARLSTVTAEADVAEAEVRRAAARVEKARSGSKARRAAFVQWQLAAIEDRAAHARQVLADERSADEFVGLQASEATLTEAGYLAKDAESARARAAREAEQADSALTDAKELRAATRTEAASAEHELDQVRTDLKAAQATLKKLTATLATVQRKAAQVGENLAGEKAPTGKVAPPTDPAPEDATSDPAGTDPAAGPATTDPAAKATASKATP